MTRTSDLYFIRVAL